MNELSTKETEDAREVLQDLLTKQADKFSQELNKRLKSHTVQQYDIVIAWWIDYIFNYSDALTSEDN